MMHGADRYLRDATVACVSAVDDTWQEEDLSELLAQLVSERATIPASVCRQSFSGLRVEYSARRGICTHCDSVVHRTGQVVVSGAGGAPVVVAQWRDLGNVPAREGAMRFGMAVVAALRQARTGRPTSG